MTCPAPGEGAADPAAAFSEFGAAAVGPVLSGQPIGAYQEIAASLDMTEGAVKTAVHRLRKRYRALLKEAVRDTVSANEEIDSELHYLLEALGG